MHSAISTSKVVQPKILCESQYRAVYHKGYLHLSTAFMTACMSSSPTHKQRDFKVYSPLTTLAFADHANRNLVVYIALCQ